MVSGLRFVPAVFLQRLCLLSAGLKHSRSDLVFKQPKSRDNFILGMLNYNFRARYTHFTTRTPWTEYIYFAANKVTVDFIVDLSS